MLEGGPEGAVYERLDGEPRSASPPAPDAPALIQYSSGTTEEPRGCILSASAISSHLERLTEKMDADPTRDVGVAWLPLSHDMGLFGALMVAWTKSGALALGTPERFLASPRSWMQDCVDFGATITVGPTFGVKLAARAAAVSPPDGNLKLRIWIVGSDHVDADALDEIHRVLGPSGLTRAAMTPAYGLAEATLAVTMTEPAQEPVSMIVDSEALLAGTLREVPVDHPDARRIVASGTPLRDTEVRVEATQQAEIASPGFGREVGEICVRAPGLASGYHARPEKTAERFCDGELHTGDLGFLDGDQLYVLGRNDDMFVVAGRNVHPASRSADHEPAGGAAGQCRACRHAGRSRAHRMPARDRAGLRAHRGASQVDLGDHLGPHRTTRSRGHFRRARGAAEDAERQGPALPMPRAGGRR